MILREVLAVFGLDYDGSGQQKAERGLAGLKSQADVLQTAFTQILTAGAVAAPFLALTKMASDAQENLNLLQLSFGESAKGIEEWSNTAAGEIGRSRYTLRELAAEFGGLLAPMVGVGEELADMSMGLTKLAVDLSSARNVTENEALQALQSGLSGNIIAMKRFGVNLSAVRVEQEALNRGWGKSTKNLTQAQLATIRYSLIMKDLKFIQGDAAATSEMFANSSRALRDALKDIGTELGLFLLPAFEEVLMDTRSMLKPLQDMAVSFREWAADTNLAKAAIFGLGVVMTAMLLPLLLKVAPLLLAFGLFTVVMDDVITTFKGGNSIIGLFTKALDTLEKEGFPGLSTPVQFVLWLFNRFRDVLGAVGVLLYSLYEAMLLGEWAPFSTAVKDLVGDFDDLSRAIDSVYDKVKSFFGFIAKVQAKGVISSIIGSAVPGSGLLNAAATVTGTDVSGGLLDKGRAALGAVGDYLGGGSIGSPSPAISGGGGKNVTVNQGNRTINMAISQSPGEPPEEFARRVTELIQDNEERSNQAVFKDLVQVGAQ